MSQGGIISLTSGGGGGVVNSVTGTNGVTASPTTGNVVVSGVNATTSTVGVASFNPTEFTVSGAGEVSLLSPSSPAIQTITGNDSVAESPNASGNFNFLTSNTTVQFIGSTNTETLNFGLSNLLIGDSGIHSTSAAGNVGVGLSALTNVTSGQNNVVIGYFAGNKLNTAANTTLIGSGAGENMTTGTNTFIGSNAGFNITTGSACNALGNSALGNALTSQRVIAIGTGAASAYTTSESSNIIIGNNGVGGESNVIRIGAQGSGLGQQNTCFIAGIAGVNVGSVATVVTEASNQLGTAVLTAGTGVTITPTANTITISASSSVPISFATDSGTATPSAGTITIHGGSNINTSGSGSTVTINVNNQLLMTNGSSSAPSYSFANGTNVGMYYDGGSKLVLNGTNGQIFNADAGTISINSANINAQGINITSFLQLNYKNPGAYPYTVTSNDNYISIDSSAGAHTINFPNAPNTGRTFIVKDRTGNAGTNNITLTTPGGTVTFDGSTTFVIDSNYGSVQLIFNGSNYEVY